MEECNPKFLTDNVGGYITHQIAHSLYHPRAQFRLDLQLRKGTDRRGVMGFSCSLHRSLPGSSCFFVPSRPQESRPSVS